MRKRIRISHIFVLLPLAGAAQDWPCLGGPSFDFTVTNRIAAHADWSNTPPACVWRASLTDKGYAVPSVADGAVFIIDHEGSNDVVRAFALDSG